MKYTLYSGAGNTFAILEEPISSEMVVSLCNTCDADGVIFSEQDFRIRIFNRDGSEAEMCGNGLRCFIRFLMERKIFCGCYTIRTLSGTYRAWADEKNICTEFPPPVDLRWNLCIDPYLVHYLNTGVPHAVLFVDSVENLDVPKIAPLIRHHPFFPEGTNVNFVEPNTLRMRTYERGVEGETLACGTGAVASALAVAKNFSLPSPLNMEVRSGEKLKISFTPDWKKVTIEGSAIRIGEGTFSLKQESRILSKL